jgi:hypothetical protein
VIPVQVLHLGRWEQGGPRSECHHGMKVVRALRTAKSLK